MKRSSTMLLVGALVALWMVSLPHASAQAPTEEELQEIERQAEELEKKQQAEAAAKAEAKRKAEAAKKAAAAAEAKRKAAQKQAEKKRRATEEARSARPQSDGRERATEAGSALAGEFVDIPGGTFQMGCSPGDGECQDDERPVHTVSIKSFRMGKYEVTVGQFRQFVEAAGYRTDAERDRSCFVLQADTRWREQAGRDRHPVVCVSWNDAEAYVQWLSRQGVGRYRLPSESEWEYAARAGGRARYGFGDSEGMLCQYGNVADRTGRKQFSGWDLAASCDDGALYTAPVGGYRPNGFGLHDMHGNVREWTGDCYHDSYAGVPSDGAAWAAGNCARSVHRGGSWADPARFVRSSDRGWDAASDGHDRLGFRLLQDR